MIVPQFFMASMLPAFSIAFFLTPIIEPVGVLTTPPLILDAASKVRVEDGFGVRLSVIKPLF